MTVSSEIFRQVRDRAAGRCEYCRMHESLQGATYHVEHVRPQSIGGASSLDNLAWACPSCNLHKSDRIVIRDTQSGDEVPLFDPRRDAWDAHLHFSRFEIVGTTPVGRALIDAFGLNSERRIRIRQAEAIFNLFPPSPSASSP